MLYVLAGLFVILAIIAHLTREKPYLDADNPYLHPEAAESLPEDMSPFIPLPAPKENMRPHRYAVVKRALDILFSFSLLILLSPVYLIIAAAITLDDPGPVLFSQKRVGKNKQLFMLHKFRSMKTDAPHDVPTHLLADPDQYLTRVGRFLRNSSLDELPQIWDIFRGRMSLIGPRPALWNQADLVAAREKSDVNRLTPGLTGLAQVSGRDNLSIEEKAEKDAIYLRRFSLQMDLYCFMRTIRAVLRREGVAGGNRR